MALIHIMAGCRFRRASVASLLYSRTLLAIFRAAIFSSFYDWQGGWQFRGWETSHPHTGEWESGDVCAGFSQAKLI